MISSPVASTPKRTTTDFVRWQPLATFPIFCEIRSSHPEVLQRVQKLFAASLSATTPIVEGEADAVWRWEIEADGDLWRACDLETNIVFDGELARVLTNIEYSIVQRLVDMVKNEPTPFFAMHAALLHKNGFGLIVVGPSESGKSTLSCGLWRSGWQLLSDDFCFFKSGDTTQYRVFPARRRASLRDGSRAIVGEELWHAIENAPSSFRTSEGWIFHPHEIASDNEISPQNPLPASVRINAIVFLGRRDQNQNPDDAPILQPLAPTRAAFALLPYCSLLSRDEATTQNNVSEHRVLDWGAALPRIAPWVEQARVYTLQRAPLPHMLAAVESLRDESVDTKPRENA